MDKNNIPFFIAQDMYINTATKDDVHTILDRYGIDNPAVFEDFREFFKQVSTQLRFTWHPKTFLEQSSWSEFFDELKFQLQRFSKWTIEVETKEWEEKKWPISLLSLFQYRD